MERKNLPKEVLSQMADLIEKELIEKGIFFQRNGTEFLLEEHNIKYLFFAQSNANKSLIKEGKLTIEMLFNNI